ncbi:MAG: hypothetical protein D6731_25660 [Planctomycetota bacterium]|nr:MAG: hypothetical protein D6731_25660 [Planctomycetota bacterium]
MRRKVLLSSLTVGRCFTQALEPGARAEDTAGGLRRSAPILSPENAWKVLSVEEEGILARSADGTERRFAGNEEVVEIPREGYDKLAR